MGIKHFFSWFKKKFRTAIYELNSGETFSSVRADEESIKIDVTTLLVDMNGIFHTYTQKVFKYGKHEEKLFQRKPRPVPVTFTNCMELYKNVMDHVERIITCVQPSHRVVLCIDGPAPKSKQNQQR